MNSITDPMQKYFNNRCQSFKFQAFSQQSGQPGKQAAVTGNSLPDFQSPGFPDSKDSDQVDKSINNNRSLKAIKICVRSVNHIKIFEV